MKRPSIGIALGLGALLGVIALAGCSGGNASSLPAGGSGGNAGDVYSQAGNAQDQAPNAPLPTDRLIARTASVTLVVDDVKVAVASLHDVATNAGGWVSSESMTLPTDANAYGYASVQLSVPSAKLDDALSKLEAVGNMTDRSIQSEDVTEQVADTDSRIATMRASIARLQDLISRSGSVSDIAAVESQLTQREADLESLLAVQKSLAQRVATATIDVTVSTQPPPVVQTGPASALSAGWHAMTATGRFIFIALAALLPWLVLAAVIVVPIVLVRRRHRRAMIALIDHPLVPASVAPAYTRPDPVPVQSDAADPTAPAAPVPPQATAKTRTPRSRSKPQ